jgi:hypothetical protein
MTNLASLLFEAAERSPHVPAVRLDEAVLDYASLLVAAVAQRRCCRRTASSPVTGLGSSRRTCRRSRSPTSACCWRAARSSR